MMKIDEKYCEELFKVVAPRGPQPKHYVQVCLAFYWIRYNIEDYQGWIEKHFIKPHRESYDLPGYLSYNLMLDIWDKPRGFNGDSDLIQKMYNCYELSDASEDEHNLYVKTRWDHFLCGRPEFLGLQHRKIMFKEQLNKWILGGAKSFVDLGCGNGSYTHYAYRRFTQLLPPNVERGPIIGIDSDYQGAVTERLQPEVQGPSFLKQNVLKKMPPYQCDIVYSGGLFDYFSDEIFKVMLDRIKSFEPKAIMIGNVQQGRYTKALMECLDWKLFDRSRWELLELGASKFHKGWTMEVQTDPTEKQHFLVVTR